MDFSTKDMELNTKKAQKKAKRIWKELNDDSIEISFRTSPMGILLLAGTIMAVVCISKCKGKMEQQKALKKQAKELSKASDEKN